MIEIRAAAPLPDHIYKTIRMFLGNQEHAAGPLRDEKYAGLPSRKTFASSTMIVSGLWLFAFLIVHVKTFRFGVEQEWPAGGRDLYRLEMQAFTNPLIVGFYIISMVVVASHLWHGVASAFQSLGLDQPAWTRFILPAGKTIAVLIATGFIIIALWPISPESVMKLDRGCRPARSARSGTGTSSR